MTLIIISLLLQDTLLEDFHMDQIIIFL